MASILDKYGIKEVADITFYELDKNGKPAYPVLYIDTAKTSTIEQTAEETTAKGGKGNPSLISWDYNKDINVTLEDALFTTKSLAIMFGNGTATPLAPEDIKEGETVVKEADRIMRTEIITLAELTQATNVTSLAKKNGFDPEFHASNGKKYSKLNAKFYTENGISVASVGGANEPQNGDKLFCSYDLKITSGSVIEISANTFPGTYYVTGDTFARSEANGEDEFFQFILPKAKVLSENTITLEAEGDPTVFSMNLHVLRPADGVMMKLVKYDLAGVADDATATDLYHNHVLNAPQNHDNSKIAVTEEAKLDVDRVAGMNAGKTEYITNFKSAT